MQKVHTMDNQVINLSIIIYIHVYPYSSESKDSSGYLLINLYVTATVEVHSLKSISSGLPEFQELHGFPGPLVPGVTHKGEVIQFCQGKINNAKSNHGSKNDLGRFAKYFSFNCYKNIIIPNVFEF